MTPSRPSSARSAVRTWAVLASAAAVVVVALALAWRGDEPVREPDPLAAPPVDAARDPADVAPIGIPPAPAPVSTQPGAAQDVRPPDVATQPFPQLHTKPRRERKEGEKPRRAKAELYESEKELLFDTAEPLEVPFEGDFPERGTFSFWLNPVWDPANQDDASFVTVADGKLRIVKNVNFLRFETVDPNGNPDGVGFRISDWQPGEWHFVTATWDAGVIGLYVDGQLVGQKYIPSLDIPADSSVFVGSLFPPGRPIAPGLMSTFRFRGRVVNPGTVGREYETTAPPPVGEEPE